MDTISKAVCASRPRSSTARETTSGFSITCRCVPAEPIEVTNSGDISFWAWGVFDDGSFTVSDDTIREAAELGRELLELGLRRPLPVQRVREIHRLHRVAVGA